jgi:HK97 family phage portal protein
VATLWDTTKQFARSFVYGPPPSPMLARQPRVEARATGIGDGIPNHLLASFTTADYLRAGGLIHGPGATDALRRAFEAGDDSNSLVAICLFRLATDFPQAPLRVYKASKGDRLDPLPDHALTRLLARPNAHMSGSQLWWWTTYVKNAHGNAYWRKIRAGKTLTGNVIELWPLSPTTCKPVREKGSANFIDYYLYKFGPAKRDEEAIPIENIVHHRTGLDDRDLRLGLSRLRKVLTEITTDDRVATYMDRLLVNGAIPGLVILTDKDSTLDAAGAQAVKESIERGFTGDNLGRAAVMSGAVRDAKQLGFDPKSMDLSPLSGLSETRICGIFGIPPQVAGTRVGLSASTFSNYQQAYESYMELTILPQYGEAADTVNLQLLPDFSAANWRASTRRKSARSGRTRTPRRSGSPCCGSRTC